MLKALLSLTLLFSPLALAAKTPTAQKVKSVYVLPHRTSIWFYQSMSNGQFSAGIQRGPSPAFKGYLNCYFMNDMGEAPGGVSCLLIAHSKFDVAQGLRVPDRSTKWLFELMEQDGNFRDGQSGPESFLGYINCGLLETDSGNGASAAPYCQLSTRPILN